MAHGGPSLKAVAESLESKPRDALRTIGRLLRYLLPFKAQLGVGILFVVLSAATMAGGPVLIGFAVNIVKAGATAHVAAARAGALRELALAMLGLSVFYVLNFVSMREQILRIGIVGQHALAQVRSQIFAKVQDLSLSFFDTAESGDLMSRLVNDVDTLNTFLGQGFAQLVGNIFGLAGVLVVMLYLNWRLALATMAVVPFMFVTTRGFGYVARSRYRATRETIGNVSAELQEELAGIKVTQAFSRGEANVERFQERNAANRDANISAVAVSSAFTPALDILSAVTTAVVAGYGGYLAITGAMTIGLVVTFLIFSQNFFRLISQISSIYAQAQAALAGGERIFMLLDRPVDLTDAPDAVEMPRIEGRIDFEHVDFGYTPETPVLKDSTWCAEPGQTIALVGPTGAGKTTVINLLTRFYDVTGGAVKIDGTDVRRVTRASLRSQMGVVLQESFLFAGTVMDNIRYGRLEATDEEVVAAAKLVNADDFIRGLPEGYETALGERGGGLSQGQRQLIAFARAVIANPRILILDEATASVDTRTELLIQRALAKLLEGRTSVVIAHRLSTITRADEILVIDGGRIVERGTHDELIAAGGMYDDLYTRQFAGVG
jgi:ATP-binding cassette, subfamily B, multidrug efflux pump